MTAHTHRGWSISFDFPPIPMRDMDWSATSPDYDASYEGPEDGWVSSGGHVTAATLDGVKAEIDAWIAADALAALNAETSEMVALTNQRLG